MTSLEKMFAARRTIGSGIHTCPFCNKKYIPKHSSAAEAMATMDMESREQWISGCCSNECWDKHIPEEE